MPEIPGMDKAGDMTLSMFYKMGAYIDDILIILLVLGACWGVFVLLSYKYPAEVYIRRSGGSKDDFSIGQIKWDRIREITTKGGVRMWQFLRSRKLMNPLDDKYILPGNKVKVFQVNADSYIPVSFHCGNPEASLEVLSGDTRFWMMNEIARAAQDYQVQSTWEKMSPYIIMMVTIGGCLALTGVVIYFAFQDASQITSAMSGLTESMKSFSAGVAPS
jgi:hypothetical protein